MTRPLRPFVALCAAAAACLVLAACSSAPAPQRQALPAAAAAGWQAPLPASGAPAASADWWNRFDDPLLAPLVAQAQTASATLASAAARIERARAARVVAGAALLPRLDAVAGVSNGRAQPRTPAGISASLGVQAAWELDLFGANRAARDAAQARLQGAEAALHDARTAVAAETATSYLALRACEAQRVQTGLDAASRAETARLTDASANAGFTAPGDAALARAGAAQARSQALAQQAACDTLVKSLVELTDSAEPALRARLAPGSARVPQAPAVALPALPAQLLAQRPDVAEAARNVIAAAGDRDRARAGERPQISISGSLAGATLRTGQGTTSGATWSFGPLTVSLPLFDGGARAAATSAAQAGYDEAVALYQAQLRRALREVEASLVALQSSAAREADARAAAQDFGAFLAATEARQKGGLASLFDLENARRNAVAAQSALIDLQRERTAAWIALFRALGGGWSAADIPQLPA